MIYLTTQPPRKRGGWTFGIDQVKAGRILFPRFWRRNSGSIIQAERTGNADCFPLLAVV